MVSNTIRNWKSELKRISKSSFKEHCYWKRYLWVVWYWQWHFCNISTQDLEIDQIVLNTEENDNTEKEESIEEKFQIQGMLS